MKSAILALALIMGAGTATTINPATAAGIDSPTDAVIVTVDRAKLFRINKPAATVIIGNPAIADVTVEDERTLVLTGRSFGVTNLMILNEAGELIVDRTIVVRGHEANTVRIYRRSSRETYACAPVCEPTLTIGDNPTTFKAANSQIKARNDLNEKNALPSGQ